MDQYKLIAQILWGGFAPSIIALMAGLLIAQHRERRGAALTLLFIAVLGTLAFSFVGGFSIGRFTAVIPVLVTGYVVAIGRGPTVVASCVVGAAVFYLAFSWLFTPLVLTGGVLALLFGFWAIPTYAIVAPGCLRVGRAKPSPGAWCSSPLTRPRPLHVSRFSSSTLSSGSIRLARSTTAP